MDSTVEAKEFERLVTEAIESLPLAFKNKLDNLAIVIADWPSKDQLRQLGLRHRAQLLGLYEGVPRTHRGTGYNMVPPDRITLFQKSIEAKCHTSTDIKAEISRVLRHEIAHDFGLSDAALDQIEREE